MNNRRQQSAFSLLEITIAISIIALLIAAVTTVSNIKEKAYYNSMVEDINTIASAVTEFQSSYSGIPGDIYNATNFFGTIVDNGNGNNILDTANTLGNESRDFWEHLSRAGLIEGTFDGGSSNEPGVGVMEAPFKNGGYYAATTTAHTLTITVGKYHSGTFTSVTAPEGLLDPAMVENYDLTYDDGDATTGNVIALEGSDFSAGDCHTAGTYNTTSDEKACIMRIVIIN